MDLYGNAIWIGLYKDLEGEGGWIWHITGDTAIGVQWGLEQPSNAPVEIYGCYVQTEQKIHDCNWHDNFAFICEI